MARVSVLGSGMMGSALSRAFLAAGHDVKVLDLDQKKTEPLVQLGATAATDGVELAKHAEILIPSLPTYGAFQSFLESDGVLPALKGATIVQLSSGSPAVVEAFAHFIDGTGVDYIEGRIKTYPSQIGKGGSKIIFSGREDVFRKSEPVLGALAEHLVYLGPVLETVSVLDEGVVTASYGQIWSLIVAAKMCQSHGVSPLTFLELVRETTKLNLDAIEEIGFPEIISGDYRDDSGTATIRTWVDAANQTADAIRKSGLDSSVFDSINDLLKKADSAGHGDKSIHVIAEFMSK
jgi:3-hydroxyisobutyrate dehydrogenase-like beta-hydroxyacid dehydrogenase